MNTMTKKITHTLETATIDTIVAIVKANKGPMRIATIMSRFGCSRDSDDCTVLDNARKVERLALDALYRHPNLESGKSDQVLVYISNETLAARAADREWEVATRAEVSRALEDVESSFWCGEPVYNVDDTMYSVRANRHGRTITVQRFARHSNGDLVTVYSDSSTVSCVENVLPYMRLRSRYLKDLSELQVN